MISKIDGDPIDRTVIGGFTASAVECDVLLEDVCSGGMRSYGEIRGKQQIGDAGPARDPNTCSQGRAAGRDVGHQPPVNGEPLLYMKRMDDAVGEGKEQQPNELAPTALLHEPRLPSGCYVGIKTAHAEMHVMQEV